ncbi:uncharacterized protein MYCFIDRAFT_32915 [Pseudocercospora fijiensis CIRAD86]|uniref:Adenosine deaminase n=1 Tax=Pseudocercospora fijiensis (strain CIRAD86) TaxID=383855 RepID=N1QCT9_PSEFD|nr:uncharacterized protein MYCFIDRAFT_32915 [Pseudocercospora fijiensis CIRAD86]EME89672.1 hypothetical protein MYCFIDRAFT_32915 [Pseudocercospora fijiensis CIRAD86]
MANVENALPIEARRDLRESLQNTKDEFLLNIPKVELHVHIEGCLTPELKWKISQRNKTPLIHPRTGVVFTSLAQLQDSHNTLKPADEGQMTNTEETLSFFEIYYNGFKVLETKLDYYDLAMHYFQNASSQNIRYAEIFFDPQGHIQNGTSWSTMLEGFREASDEAEKSLHVKSSWIMCFMRDESPESAMEFYEAALPDRGDMIIGVGLDSNEDGRPPNFFHDVFSRARKDGFQLTCHCDVGKSYPVENIRQVVEDIQADRIDHGLNIVEDLKLLDRVREKGLAMTICPWSYIRHQPFDNVWDRIRRLFDAGIRISIGSDDPAFMEDTWVLENLRILKKFGKFTNEDVVRLMKGAMEISWAPADVKREMIAELEKIAIAS